MSHAPGLAPSQLLPPGSAQALHTSMALLVHLKTVSELRGRGDRIAKVTFRGREAPVSGGLLALGWQGWGRAGGWMGKVRAGVGARRLFTGSHLPLA